MSIFQVESLAYKTHFNYIKCLYSLIKNTDLYYTNTLKQVDIPNLYEKRNLIDLTKKSLKDEYEIVQIDENYSYASTSWLPIKSYYLIFNILLTIEYIIKVQNNVFTISHTGCIDNFTDKLDKSEIQFSEHTLNQVFNQSILKYTVKTGANLSNQTSDYDMYKMVIRKIAEYKTENWKKQNNIRLRKSKDKTKYKKYLESFRVSIFDFPYYMRIRSNYRDFAFINGVTTTETKQYFNTFFYFTCYFVNALEKMKKELIKARL